MPRQIDTVKYHTRTVQNKTSKKKTRSRLKLMTLFAKYFKPVHLRLSA